MGGQYDRLDSNQLDLHHRSTCGQLDTDTDNVISQITQIITTHLPDYRGLHKIPDPPRFILFKGMIVIVHMRIWAKFALMFVSLVSVGWMVDSAHCACVCVVLLDESPGAKLYIHPYPSISVPMLINSSQR